jgi:hypothetical protein
VDALDGGSPDPLARAIRRAFWHLVHETELEVAMNEVAGRGEPDTAALTGLLLGAAHGSDVIPTAWRQALAPLTEPLRGFFHEPPGESR